MTDQPDTMAKVAGEMARVVETACRCSSFLDSKRDDMKQLISRYRALTSQANDDTSVKHLMQQVENMGLTVEQVREACESINWRPLSKFAPPIGKPVRVHWKNNLGNDRVSVATYYPQFFKEDDGDWDDTTTSDYREENDTYYWPEGWYEFAWEIEVTCKIPKPIHWAHLCLVIPVPARPSEGGEG